VKVVLAAGIPAAATSMTSTVPPVVVVAVRPALLGFETTEIVSDV